MIGICPFVAKHWYNRFFGDEESKILKNCKYYFEENADEDTINNDQIRAKVALLEINHFIVLEI